MEWNTDPINFWIALEKGLLQDTFALFRCNFLSFECPSYAWVEKICLQFHTPPDGHPLSHTTATPPQIA